MKCNSYEFNKHPWDQSYGEGTPLDIAINYYKNKLIDRNNRIIRLEEKLEASEKARKEAIKYCNEVIKNVESLDLKIYPKEFYELINILE